MNLLMNVLLNERMNVRCFDLVKHCHHVVMPSNDDAS